MAALLCNKISSCSATCSNPFGFLLLPTAIFTNLPPIIVGLQSLSTTAESSCKGSLYCNITLVFATCHISAIAYISAMISNRQSRRLADHSTYASRLGWLLCQDAWVASYLVIVVFYGLWLWVGIGWRLDGEVHDANNKSECPPHVGNWVDTDIFWGFIFLTAMLWMLILSFFVACCCDNGRDYSFIEIDHNDEEQVMINGDNGNGNDVRLQQTKYGAVPSSLTAAAVAVPTPSAPPYDPNIPVATAMPIDNKR